MAVNTTIRYNDNIIETITDSKTICYDTKNKILKDNLIVDVKLDKWEGDIYYPDYLCFTAITAGSTIAVGYEDTANPPIRLYYSTDRNTWNPLTIGPRDGGGSTIVTLANVNDKIYIKGQPYTTGIEYGMESFINFMMTGSVAASGNIMSIVDETCQSVDAAYYVNTYQYPFFSGLFYECTSLVTPPKLPATILPEMCYNITFRGCRNLTTVPELPATTLSDGCYNWMFLECYSLIVSDTSGTGFNKAWTIPSSGTFSNTYQQDMFSGCATGSGRSSDTMAGASGQSYTYYTQNTPIG